MWVGHWLNRPHGGTMGLLGRGHDKTQELSASPGTPGVILISGAVAGQSHPILGRYLDQVNQKAIQGTPFSPISNTVTSHVSRL